MGRADSQGRRNGKHGRVEFKLGGGETLRAITDVIDHGQKQVADRYDFAVARDYDAVSQVEAMDTRRTWMSRCCFVLRRSTATRL